MSSINARIMKLWARLPKPVIVLCRLPNGTIQELPVNECIRLGGDFLRVAAGSDLADVQRLLDSIPSVIE